jgi:nucleoid DNA-binding protein
MQLRETEDRIMARSRRKNVLPLAAIREKVDEQCTEKKVAVKDDVRNIIIDATFSVIRGALKSKNRHDGDFVDIPGLVRIYVNEDGERVVRIPRTGEYIPKGSSRSLSFKILKVMKEQIETKFAKKPGAAIKTAAEAKNAERAKAEGKEPAPKKEKVAKPATKTGGLKPAAAAKPAPAKEGKKPKA